MFLLPEQIARNDQALAGYLEARQLGVKVVTAISSAGDGSYPAADRLDGIHFHPASAPTLPLADCTRAGGCACCYVPVVLDDDAPAFPANDEAAR